jgi:hypothetical protein
MKRLRYWLFNGLAAISLVLFLALVVDTMLPRPQRPIVSLPPSTMTATYANGVWTYTSYSYAYSNARPFVHLFGRRIPRLLAFFLTAVAPVNWIALRFLERAAARRAPGLCRNCGYDLRATPDRCPECGKIAEKAI